MPDADVMTGGIDADRLWRERAPVRELVVQACRVLEADGQGDMVWGHVSVRDPENYGLWLKGAELGFDELNSGDIVLFDFDGERIVGSGARHGEYPIHTEIMKRRADVCAVVHTHPIHAIAFGVTGRPLTALSHAACHFVPPDIVRFQRTGDLVRTPELGAALAECLGPRNAVLLPHHGIVTVGSTVGQAVASAIHLEQACRIALLAGDKALASSDAEALEKRTRSERHMERAWSYLSRKVTRLQSE